MMYKCKESGKPKVHHDVPLVKPCNANLKIYLEVHDMESFTPPHATCTRADKANTTLPFGIIACSLASSFTLNCLCASKFRTKPGMTDTPCSLGIVFTLLYSFRYLKGPKFSNLFAYTCGYSIIMAI